MRAAIAQINPTSGDIDGNTDRILGALERARKEHADLLVAPEMAIPGYCIGDLLEDADFLAANARASERIARETRDIATVVGFIEHDPAIQNEAGRITKFNAAAVAQGGVVLGTARKSLLPNYRYFDDKRFFTPGLLRRPIAIQVGGRKVSLGVSICEDMWDEFYAIKPIAELAAAGADLILNINASPFYPGKRLERDAIIRRHVGSTRRPLLYVNTVGVGDNGKNIIPFDGESLAYNREGGLVAIGRQFEEDLCVVDIDDGDVTGGPIQLPQVDRERGLYDALVMSLKDYIRKTGFKDVIVPVSGGIDSALALAIAADALGADHVRAYNLPSEFNSEETRGIAATLCRAFGVPYGIIPIGEIDETIRRVFETDAHPIRRGLTRENLHARIRGILMMAESNDTGAMLISCGNETEIALGYATLYGDMCGGLSLIGDLSKVDVYAVARYVNRRHGKEMIPEATFGLVPSAELSANQRDPFDYYVVAPAVGEFVERRRSPEELVRLFEEHALDPTRFVPDPSGRTVYDKHTPDTFREIVCDAFQRMKRSVYKRLQGPPIVVVSERAFGFDLRETIIDGWNG